MTQERFVYAAKNAETGMIKIGFSFCPKLRAANLAFHEGAQVVVLGAKRGTFADEQRIHKEFSQFCYRGEWYHPSEEIIELVSSFPEYNGERITRAITNIEYCPTLNKIERRALNVPIDMTELCAKAEVAGSTISRWRAGARPRAKTLIKIYRALDALEAK